MMGESMNNSIKVSVIVPVYNVAKYLEKCILSLVNQSLKDLEIICVDDGSTDGCSAILDRLATLINALEWYINVMPVCRLQEMMPLN